MFVNAIAVFADGNLKALDGAEVLYEGNVWNDSCQPNALTVGTLFQPSRDVLDEVRKTLGTKLFMGDVIQGNFGGRRPSAPPPSSPPPSKPPQSDDPSKVDPSLFRRYFHAFFDPNLNSYIEHVDKGDTFAGNLQAYMTREMNTARVSKVRSQTIKDRAALILSMDTKSILGYLEQLVSMKLKGTDVSSMAVLIQIDRFITKAGRAIYEARDNYGLSLSETDVVDKDCIQKISETFSDRVRRAKEIMNGTPHADYEIDAMAEIKKIYGDFSSPEANKALAETQARYMKHDWMRREMIIRFRDHQLTDPMQIVAVSYYLLGVAAKLEITLERKVTRGEALDIILEQETTPEP